MKTIASLLFILLMTFAMSVSAKPNSSGFVHSDGKKLLDGNGNELFLRGMCFGNDVWSGRADPPTSHHGEKDYALLASMGFNSVRFYLNYQLFESNSKPYAYKESGFEWLSKNIEWAKKNKIYLILNMHFPHGGFQSNGGGRAFWTNDENQKRFIALWCEIARRYKDEPIILGFGLLNEPRPPVGTPIDEWAKIAQRTIDEIRKIDINHVMIVERMMMFDGLFNYWAENTNGLMNCVPVNDSNVMYEIHHYDPMGFTHQGATWLGFGEGPVYPWKSYDFIRKISRTGEAIVDSSTIDTTAFDSWTYLEGKSITATDDDWKIAVPMLSIENINPEARVWFSDFTLEETDTGGTVIQKHLMKLDAEFGWIKFDSHDDCAVSVDRTGGRNGKGALVLYGNEGKQRYEGYLHRLQVAKGHSYRLSGWVRSNAQVTGGQIKVSIGFYRNYLPVMTTDRYGTEKIMDQIVYVRDRLNAPVFLGEFGVIRYGMWRGGYQWIGDVIKACGKRGINYSFHSYHEYSFALFPVYYYESTSMNNVDKKLMDLFIDLQKDASGKDVNRQEKTPDGK